jgi:pilus assembly protein CpaD
LAAWLLAGAIPLAGCSSANYASNDPGPASDYHERYPIVVAEAPTALDVYPTGGGGLDAQSVANIHTFAARYQSLGSGRIAILAPDGERGRDARVIDQIRRALVGAGLRGYVVVGSYPPSPDPTAAAPVRLVYQGLKATVEQPCGRWPSDLASGGSIEGWKNGSYENFGCATQSTLAAQVADPRDFVQSRATGAGDVQMRLRAIGDVRNGQDPGTDWKTKLTAIGTVGSGD